MLKGRPPSVPPFSHWAMSSGIIPAHPQGLVHIPFESWDIKVTSRLTPHFPLFYNVPITLLGVRDVAANKNIPALMEFIFWWRKSEKQISKIHSISHSAKQYAQTQNREMGWSQW